MATPTGTTPNLVQLARYLLKQHTDIIPKLCTHDYARNYNYSLVIMRIIIIYIHDSARYKGWCNVAKDFVGAEVVKSGLGRSGLGSRVA